MGSAIVTTLAFVVWLVLWSLDVKALDAFLLAGAIMLVVVGVRMLARYMPQNRSA
ncbi:hypothetical protein [Conexibacter sp. SYSU D00693]|uniref:hypothetical protein n=1 Tax=Conexibacter sp. SYSU D00693 TaxID=2812560 RepID=UPI00196ADAAF|nr:hypothetical protein [Conexibacter sp. SYSU D00693]